MRTISKVVFIHSSNQFMAIRRKDVGKEDCLFLRITLILSLLILRFSFVHIQWFSLFTILLNIVNALKREIVEEKEKKKRSGRRESGSKEYGMKSKVCSPTPVSPSPPAHPPHPTPIPTPYPLSSSTPPHAETVKNRIIPEDKGDSWI